MMMKYYQSHGNNDTEIGGHYVNAAVTRNRVASSLLTDVMSHLEKLIRNFQRLKAMLAVDLIEHSTSVPGQILASINTIVQQTQYSLTEFRSEIFDKFSEYYEQNADYRVKQMVHAAKFILGHHFSFSNIDFNDTDSFDMSLSEKVFDHANAFCIDIRTFLRIDNSDANDGANFSAELLSDRSCNWQILEYCSHIDRRPVINNTLLHIEVLVEAYTKMVRSARAVLKCFPAYRGFLDEVQQWLNRALTMNASLPLKPVSYTHLTLPTNREV